MKDGQTREKGGPLHRKAMRDKDFLLVGIGASAGGIQALKEFFGIMPSDSGMAFVVVIHLSPDHESNLDEILQSTTSMKVEQVSETVKVEPNRVYVIPPGKHLEMIDGHIRLKEPVRSKGVRVPIDRFFRTLADAYKRKAVCIILSGTGTDGTVGMKHVKGLDGFAMVQDPADAEYDGMPRSAIETKIADIVLKVSEMPDKLLSVRESTEKFGLADEQDNEVSEEIKNIELLRDVLTLLRIRTGHDFSNYKRPTIIRRIARHLQIHETDDLAEYLTILRNNSDEVLSLLKNLLINVTSFFRDKDAFAALEKQIIPSLFEGKKETDHVRVWIAGCASGEEAYSLAILLCEYADKLALPPKIQIFASDVDDDAIAEAREGRFTETIVTDISPARLKKFFVKDADGFRIRKRIREMILFAPHNVLRDPPFSRLDMINCRNVMIYLNRETQDRVMQVFHFGLRDSGFLFLGSSESADSVANYFLPVDKKYRIYQCRPATKGWHAPPQMPVHGSWTPRISELPDQARSQLQSYGEIHHRLIEHYAPPSVLVSAEGDIIHLSDRAGRYLRFAGGEPTTNLLKVAHPMLLSDLRAAIFAAKRDNQPVESKHIRVKINGVEKLVDILVRPIGIPETAFLIIFTESDAENEPANSIQTIVAGDKAVESVVRGLEEELRQAKDQLRNTIEQYETSVEEQKASNEELQAINEELRSASEELETSKEELQSLNEELTTINHEYKDKLEEITRTNSDLQNLIQSTDIGTIFLDRSLRIKRYTPAVGEIFNVIPGDIGRPLAHLTHHIIDDHFSKDAAIVLKSLQSSEREVNSTDGQIYLVRFSPYRSIEDKIEGVVISFIDVTARRQAERDLRREQERMRMIVESAKDFVIFSTDLDRRIDSWNPGAELIFGYTEGEIIGSFADILYTEDDRANHIPAKEMQKALRKRRAENERWHVRKDGSLVYGSGLVMPLQDDHGTDTGLVKIMRDLTREKNAESALRESEQTFRQLVENSPFGIYVVDGDFRLARVGAGAQKVFEHVEPLIGRDFAEVLRVVWPEPFATEVIGIFRHTLETGESYNSPRTIETRHDIGETESYDWKIERMSMPDGRFGIVCHFYDLSERLAYEMALRSSEERFQLAAEAVKSVIYDWDITSDHVERSGELTAMLGFDPLNPEVQTNAWYCSRLHPEDDAYAREIVKEALSSGVERFEDEYRLRHHDGRFIYVRDVGLFIRNDDGKAVRCVGSITDISGRKAAEAAIREKVLLETLVGAQEDERKRIARDLHDELGQQLTGLRFRLDYLRNQLADNEAATARIDEIDGIAKEIDHGVNFLAWELRPAILDHLGLIPTLESYVKQWSKQTEISINLFAPKLKHATLPPDVETNLYRIVQESLTNIRRHTHATTVEITLKERGNDVVLIVEDNGEGFDSSIWEKNERGSGLPGMKERAILMGGELQIDSEAGGGTTIFARWPFRTD